MKINFNELELTVNPNFKGGDGEYRARTFFDGLNKIMLGTLSVGSSIGVHTHETNSEIIYIISGEGSCFYDNTSEKLLPGDCHYCPKGHTHGLRNSSANEELVFFAIVPEQ